MGRKMPPHHGAVTTSGQDRSQLTVRGSEALTGTGAPLDASPAPNQPRRKANSSGWNFPLRKCRSISRSPFPHALSSSPGSLEPPREYWGWPRAPLTIAGHAQRQAFLQAAVLAAVAVGAVDQAVPLPRAGVAGIVLLAAPKKTLRGTGTGWEGARWDGSTCPARAVLTLQPSQVITP